MGKGRGETWGGPAGPWDPLDPNLGSVVIIVVIKPVYSAVSGFDHGPQPLFDIEQIKL